MICVACGGDVPAGSRFCPRCGRVTSTVEGSAPPDMPPQGAAPPPPPPPQAYGAPPAGPVAHGLANLGPRIGALCIDGFITWVMLVLGFIIAAFFASMSMPEATFDNPDPSPTGLGGLLVLLFGALGVAAAAVYYPFFEGRPQGQTFGKRAMGIRVVRQSNGASLGYGLAIGRTLSRLLDAIIFGIPLGLLWAIWDPRHQTWHDKIAGTLVVDSSVYPPPSRTPGAPPGYQVAPPSNPYQAR